MTKKRPEPKALGKRLRAALEKVANGPEFDNGISLNRDSARAILAALAWERGEGFLEGMDAGSRVARGVRVLENGP